jgi:hypothetical protein
MTRAALTPWETGDAATLVPSCCSRPRTRDEAVLKAELEKDAAEGDLWTGPRVAA